MRRPIAVFTALALAFALLGFSRSILLTAASQPIRKTALRIGDQDTPYTANADYAVAVPAITLDDGWQTILQIQNTGDTPTSARIELFGPATAACSAARQPAATRCVGPIPAGATRSVELYDDPLSPAIRSAMVYSAQSDGTGCSSATGEPLAVLVRRAQIGSSTSQSHHRRTLITEPVDIASSTYVGITPAVAGFWNADQKAYVTIVPWIEVTSTKQTTLHLQNIGLGCANEIELEFISGPSGCVPVPGSAPDIPAGHSLQVDLTDVFEGGFKGNLWIRSPQPLAVVVDRWPEDGTMLSSHATGRKAGNPNVDAPLILQNDGRWHTELRSQNSSTRFTALVDLSYRTTEITPTVESETIVCPGGSASIDTAEVTRLTVPFTGTVSLHSLGTDPDLPEIPGLATEVDLLGAGTGAAYHAPNRITGTLSTPSIALPWLTRAYRPVTVTLNVTYTSQIAVVNQSDAVEGFISLSFYDADGSVTTYQPEVPLGPRAMRLIDLKDLSELPTGWHGSAVLQFLSLQPDAGAAVTVLETAIGGSGDTTTAYAGIATEVQTQPTPTPMPSPTITATPTVTATPQPTLTPTATSSPTPQLKTYLPLLHR